MQNPGLKAIAISLSAWAFAASYAEQAAGNDDVTYFAVVKNHVFAQDWQQQVSETGYSFLAYIFVRPDSRINDAYLTFPGPIGRKQAFPDFRELDGVERDTYLFIRSEKIFADQQEFDALYPDGVYTVEFTTPAGLHRAEINVSGSVYPQAAIMSLYQSDARVEPFDIDPQKDLRVVWGGFPQGRADPKGILDDVVFVIVKDCQGGKVLHSGRPYQGFHLLYTDRDYTIPAQTMLPGRAYELVVDNGLRVDSNIDAGLPGVGFYAQTNKMPIHTAGTAGPETECSLTNSGRKNR